MTRSETTTTESRRRGACPSAGAAMVTGDGLLSRVRLPGGRITPQQLASLAELAERWGNGELELTSRGNLQFRGLTDGGAQALTEQLVIMGLAVRSAASEAARNVLCSPAADLDPVAIKDPWPLAREMDAVLSTETDLQALPAKFRFVLNGGGTAHLWTQDADIRADAITTLNGTRYRVALAGNAYNATPLGLCPPEAVVPAMLSLARRFLHHREQWLTEVTRLAPILETLGAEAFQLDGLASLGTGTESLARNSRPGPRPGPQPGWFGAAIPFGRFSSQSARALAQLADTRQLTLRLTPWRQILLGGASPSVAAELEALDLITHRHDPRLSAVACPGAPDCLSGTTATREHALHWAEQVPALFDGHLVVHVSGCSKGCARPRPAPVTLTARDGHYDLILNDRADPATPDAVLCQDLAPEAVTRWLQDLAALLQRHRQGEEPLAAVIRRLEPSDIRAELTG